MIYLCLAHMSEAGIEQKYVKEAFDTNWVVPMGPNVNAFEKDLEAFVNSKSDGTEPLDRKVVCLSAGTAAVHLSGLAMMHRMIFPGFIRGMSIKTMILSQ